MKRHVFYVLSHIFPSLFFFLSSPPPLSHLSFSICKTEAFNCWLNSFCSRRFLLSFTSSSSLASEEGWCWGYAEPHRSNPPWTFVTLPDLGQRCQVTFSVTQQEVIDAEHCVFHILSGLSITDVSLLDQTKIDSHVKSHTRRSLLFSGVIKKRTTLV